MAFLKVIFDFRWYNVNPSTTEDGFPQQTEIPEKVWYAAFAAITNEDLI